MRVLHAYSGNLYGGIETLLSTLARCRALAPGLEHRFALCHDGRLAEELRGAGVPVDLVPAARFSRPWTVRAARIGLRRVADEARPDAVVCHGLWPHAVFAPAARRAGLPLVFWQHDMLGGRHWIDRLAARARPDLVIVNSRASAETTGRVFPGVPSEVLFYPVSPPAPRPEAEARAARLATRRDLGTPDDAAVLITTCRLEHYKGPTLLIEALSRLRDLPGWVSWVAGGAQRPHEVALLEELRRKAEAGGIANRVRFLGQRSDVPDLLAAADVHCQPNLGPEPFGIAFVEALYAGLPVVTTRIGGAVEIVTEGCGLLVPPADPAALAGALASLVADPERREALGRGGPPRARAICDPAAAMASLAGSLGRLGVPKGGGPGPSDRRDDPAAAVPKPSSSRPQPPPGGDP